MIVAAGRGTRVGAGRAKQYLPLAGEPMLRHAVRAFLGHPGIAGVRVVIHADDRAVYDTAVAGLDLAGPVTGGAERQDSVRAGLESLVEFAPTEVLIHDAARPLVEPALIDRCLAALKQHAAVLPVLAVADSLKRLDGDSVACDIDRAGLYRAQTPQGFRFATILDAHRRAAGGHHTDDASVAAAAGIAVHTVAGSERAFKVTTAEDLARAGRELGAGMADIRVGQGFDVHAFEAGDRVYLCGVEIPHEAALKGHSDADVGLHALTDALLGAIGDGDIGSHFLPSDPQWRGVASDRFLRHAGERVRAAGARITAVDVTLICEAPKVGPHREAMRARIADILGLEVGRVSVKATTTERLGFTGRREGIAAQALATVAFDGPAR
ncbi:Bifunctional enzyme IspD/IspF [Oceanibacterium hippocampi]|uniref:Bifunctional enzyme IspD/IspF n=1 Tax=Oceanibacterium hippocampi TaxID=745714 RepID=A0A1Y5T617_9PROT|nr:bifunctional 2-C-methyl-D-erythritol 4-phosphate cytidylyltransferase/2-C-methyl-D-erythritol 2,4-cyclodiphosphate synthase [Oceanibacterium hippocampi]SLN54637.1 Bifunctional enzyme IspD/IspF [Oceanibacterium hippocampi]